MRIFIIHQYYKTPQTGGAIRSYYIAKYLKSKGHDVSVITARNNRAYSIDQSEGYDVHYLPVYYENHLSFLSRIHAFFLFAWKAYKLLKSLPKPDLNYVITTPLTTGFVATRAKKKLGIPYLFEVGDLWPDAPIQLGVLKNPLLKYLALRWEYKFYSKADQIVALSTDIKAEIEKKCPLQKVNVVTNFADQKLFESNKKSIELESKYKTEGHLVISYFGTVGLANELEYLIDAANAVKNEKIKFLVAGGGARYNAIKKMAEKYALQNMMFFEHRNKFELEELVNITDAIYVSFKNVPVLASGSPNKFFDGLAAGKMVIINFQGWIKELIEKERCGFYYQPTESAQFLEKIRPYIANTDLLEQAQSRAHYLSEQYSPEAQLSKLDEIIDPFNPSKT